MENINIENVIEEAVESVTDIAPEVPVQKTGGSTMDTIVIAGAVYIGFEVLKTGVKKAIGFGKNLWAKHQAKKKYEAEEAAIHTPIEEIDEDENK